VGPTGGLAAAPSGSDSGLAWPLDGLSAARVLLRPQLSPRLEAEGTFALRSAAYGVLPRCGGAAGQLSTVARALASSMGLCQSAALGGSARGAVDGPNNGNRYGSPRSCRDRRKGGGLSNRSIREECIFFRNYFGFTAVMCELAVSPRPRRASRQVQHAAITQRHAEIIRQKYAFFPNRTVLEGGAAPQAMRRP